MKNLVYVVGLFITVSIIYSCSDLTESVRDTALSQEVLDDPNAAEQTLAPVYAGMQNLMASHNWLNNLQGMSSIEQITPFRGGTDWFDGGRFIEMHQHTWAPTHVSIIDVWGGATQGVARAAIAERTIDDIGGSDVFKAEARGLKALYNYWLLDLFNVTFEKKAEDIGTTELSTVYRDGEAVEWLLSELDAIEDQLPTVDEVGETRFNKSAAIGLKARLLLNKGVYADRYANTHTHESADMQEVINYTTQLIDSGDFELEAENYFDLFSLANEGSAEIIFAFRQNIDTGGSANMPWFHSSRNRHASVQNPNNVGSDGAAFTQEFYDLWEGHRDDPRFFQQNLPDGGSIPDEEFQWNRGVAIGQQYGIIPDDDGPGTWQRDEDGNLLILPIVDEARSGQDLIYTREVGLESDNGHVAGSRSLKWQQDPNGVSRNQSGVNMPWLRLGEIYLMRAEAYARMDNWGAALTDINDLRDARGARGLDPSELSSLDELQREWIYELYHEHWTRTIQIRFETWEDTWRDKTRDDPTRRVFPIPQEAIDAARGEPGFLDQNPGY